MSHRKWDTRRKSAHTVAREQFVYAIELMDNIQLAMREMLLEGAEHPMDWKYQMDIEKVVHKLEDILTKED